MYQFTLPTSDIYLFDINTFMNRTLAIFILFLRMEKGTCALMCIAELSKIACDVPVEDVELVVGHGGDDLLDGGHGDEVPGRVNEQATVGVRRAVLYLPHNTNINQYLLLS
jgi:hypothetical protein